MTALAASRTIPISQQTDPRGFISELPVAASTTIYAGGFVGIIATGYVQPLVAVAVGTTLTGGDRFIGIAAEEVDNSSGSAGDKTCRIWSSGEFYTAVSGLAITDVGAPVFASDDNVVTKVALGNAFVGFVTRFTASGYGWVRMPGPMQSGGLPCFRRITPAIETVAANKALVIHPTENQNGLLILHALGLVVEAFAGDTEDQGIVTIEDTAGTDLATLTPSDAGADAIGDIIQANVSSISATGVALVVVPAGLGVQCLVSQLTSGASEAGSMKVYVEAVPVA
jgi:hypothetical protein